MSNKRHISMILGMLLFPTIITRIRFNNIFEINIDH